MARYIDADALLNNLPDDLPYKASVKRVLMQAPTADVVPKSEVAILNVQLEAMRGAANSYKMHYEKAKAEVAREIFEEIESKKIFLIDRVGQMGIVVRIKDIAELKKKYIEGE